MAPILVTGATGTLGSRLVELTRQENAIVVGRSASRLARRFPRATHVEWDGQGAFPEGVLEGVEAVYHFAGEPIASGYWTEDKKGRIRDSRVLGTQSLVDALERTKRRPKVLVSASAVGFYGSRGDEVLDEDSAHGAGFLAEVCRAWEHEAAGAVPLGVRVVPLRIGIVLSRAGGALERMLPLFRLGLGGRLGDGRQWMPWIHEDDVVGLALHAARNDRLRGPVNVVAPHPVMNAEFSAALARAVDKRTFLPVPTALLRLALGELADVVLASQSVTPARADDYSFRYPELRDALAALVGGEIPAHASEVRA